MPSRPQRKNKKPPYLNTTEIILGTLFATVAMMTQKAIVGPIDTELAHHLELWATLPLALAALIYLWHAVMIGSTIMSVKLIGKGNIDRWLS